MAFDKFAEKVIGLVLEEFEPIGVFAKSAIADLLLACKGLVRERSQGMFEEAMSAEVFLEIGLRGF